MKWLDRLVLFGVSLIATPLLLFLGLWSVGAGEGNYVFAVLLFPFPIIANFLIAPFFFVPRVWRLCSSRCNYYRSCSYTVSAIRASYKLLSEEGLDVCRHRIFSFVFLYMLLDLCRHGWLLVIRYDLLISAKGQEGIRPFAFRMWFQIILLDHFSRSGDFQHRMRLGFRVRLYTSCLRRTGYQRNPLARSDRD